MNVFRFFVFLLCFAAANAWAQPFGKGPNVNMNQKGPLILFLSNEGADRGPVYLHASTLFDGKGGRLTNVTLTIENGKITRIEPGAKPVVQYDLAGLTVMPGWIDTHVHPGGHFDLDGRAHRERRWGKSWMQPVVDDTPTEIGLFTVENLYAVLMSGFTTIQSPGSPADKPYKLWEQTRGAPFPRILTSLSNVNDYTGTPEQIRAFVRKQVTDGADFIKIRASMSIRGSGIAGADDSGKTLMSSEQLDAACGEANALGKRTLVHAQNEESVALSVRAGCTSIEHGRIIDDGVLDEMVKRGTYFDSNNGLVLQNYLDYKQQYLGQDNFTEQGYAYIERGLRTGLDTFKRAYAKGVKIIFGTDANAGAFGRQVEEMLWRVQIGDMKPMDNFIAATSLAAESIRMQDQIGSIAPGMRADIIALDGDPIKDIAAVRRVVFVMKDGKVFKNVSRSIGSTQRTATAQ